MTRRIKKKHSINTYFNRYLRGRYCLITDNDEEPQRFRATIKTSDMQKLIIFLDGDDEEVTIDKRLLGYITFKTLESKESQLDRIIKRSEMTLAKNGEEIKKNEEKNENIKKKYEFELTANLNAPRKGQVCNVFMTNNKVLKDLEFVAVSRYEMLFHRKKEDEIVEVLIFKHAITRVEFPKKLSDPKDLESSETVNTSTTEKEATAKKTTTRAKAKSKAKEEAEE